MLASAFRSGGLPAIGDMLDNVGYVEPGFEPPPSSDLQELIDQGGEVVFPAGEFVEESLKLRSDLRIVGPPVGRCIIKQAASAGSHTRLFTTEAGIPIENVRIERLFLDGQSGNHEDGEWRAGVFLNAARNVELVDLDIQNMAGDGIHIYQDCSLIDVERVRIKGNGRGGVVLTGGGTRGVTIDRSEIISGDYGQSIDGEVDGDGSADNVTISRCHLENVAGRVAGTAAAAHPNHTRGWCYEKNTIIGGLHLNGSQGCRVDGNTIKAAQNPAINGYYTTFDLLVADNDIEYEGADYAIRATRAHGLSPEGMIVHDNHIRSAAHGMKFWAVQDLQVHDNVIEGAGAGVYLRSTADTFANYLHHNKLKGFEEGFVCQGYQDFVFDDLRIRDNQFRDVSVPLLDCPEGSS